MEQEKIKNILRLKNREIKHEREKIQAKEITNVIISAYLSLLVERLGSVRIPKKEISRALGGFVTTAVSDGDDYIITVEEICGKSENGGNE